MGGFVITWSDRSTGDTEIRMQQYASDGTPVGGERAVNTTTAEDQFFSQIAAADDGFVVVWTSEQDTNPIGNTDIKLQRYAVELEAGPLVIDQSGTVVTNAEDRTGDPAVLISGDDNTFTNQTGATLTGTGTNDGFRTLDAAVEATGTGNTIVNEQGALMTGFNGVASQVANTTLINAGEIAGVNVDGPTGREQSYGVRLDDDARVENTGLIRAEAADSSTGVLTVQDSSVDNQGTVQVVSGFRGIGINVGSRSSISNSGDVDVVADFDAFGINGTNFGNTLENSGTISVSGSGISSYIGIRANAIATIVNSGEISVLATNDSGSASGIRTIGGQNTVRQPGHYHRRGHGHERWGQRHEPARRAPLSIPVRSPPKRSPQARSASGTSMAAISPMTATSPPRGSTQPASPCGSAVR